LPLNLRRRNLHLSMPPPLSSTVGLVKNFQDLLDRVHHFASRFRSPMPSREGEHGGVKRPAGAFGGCTRTHRKPPDIIWVQNEKGEWIPTTKPKWTWRSSAAPYPSSSSIASEEALSNG
jgi:hypothetical protein